MSTGREPEAKTSSESLSNRQVILSVYDRILQKYPHEEFDFREEPPKSVVVENNDGHTSRRGYALYDYVSRVKTGEKEWILALGTRTEGLQAQHVAFDLKAIPYDGEGKTDDEQTKEIRTQIIESSLTRNSLLVATTAGMYPPRLSRPSNELYKKLKPLAPNYVAQEPEIDYSQLNLPTFGLFDFEPQFKTAMTYKPEFVEVVANSISEVLEA